MAMNLTPAKPLTGMTRWPTGCAFDEHRDAHPKNSYRYAFTESYTSSGFATGSDDSRYGTTADEEFEQHGPSCLQGSRLNPDLAHRARYFLPLSKTGNPLRNFTSTYMLTGVIYEALLFHSKLYKACGILHGDISPGNVVFTNKRDSALVDWDLSREPDSRPYPHSLENVGTRSFRSYAFYRAHHQYTGPLTYSLRDELESFLWVLLYMIMRYRRLNYEILGSGRQFLAWDLHEIFDIPIDPTDGVPFELLSGKGSFLRETDNLENDYLYRGRLPQPLRRLLIELRPIFLPLYELPEIFRDKTIRECEEIIAAGIPPVDYPLVENHDAMLDAFAKSIATDGWYEDDKAEDQYYFLQLYHQT
ncbi:hypothetical protein PENSPDRAFT_756678 [Peniophora sp. CONT]|nr:hypothetical protein PENSPDRAFT_756678 [Peniophora sp. CONT]